MACKWYFIDPKTGKQKAFKTEKALNDFISNNKEKIISDVRDSNVLLNQEARGAFNTVTQVMYALTNPNVSTPVHELAHFWEKYLTDNERKTILDWHNSQQNVTQTAEWTREVSESFARGFELYLTEGNKTTNKKLDSIFEKFAKWLADIYKDVKEALGLELNDGMRKVYSDMIKSEFISKSTKDELSKTLITEVSAPEEKIETIEDYEKIGLDILNEYGKDRFGDWLANQPLIGDGFNKIKTIAARAGIPFPQTFKEFTDEVTKNGGIDNYMKNIRFDEFYNYITKTTTTKKETPAVTKEVTPTTEVEKVPTPTTQQLTYEKNIETRTGLDGEEIVVVDSEGNMIANPDNELDGYTFETLDQAKAFIDNYNKTAAPLEVAPEVKDVFEQTEEDTSKEQKALTRNAVTLVENKEQTKKQGTPVTDVTYKGKVLDSILEDVEEVEKKTNYRAETTSAGDINILENNRIVRTFKLDDIESDPAAFFKVFSKTLTDSEKQTLVDYFKQKSFTAKTLEDTYSELRKNIYGNKIVSDKNVEAIFNRFASEINAKNEEMLKREVDAFLAEAKKGAKISNGWYNTKSEYLGETKSEAINSIVEKYNEENKLIKQADKAKKEYVFFTDGKGANKVNLVGEIVKIDGKVYTLQDNKGNTYEKVVTNRRSLVTATEQDFMKEVEYKKPLPKYAIGDRIKTLDGREYVITDIDSRQIPNTAAFEVLYLTDAGVSIPEVGVEGKVRKTVIDNAKEVKAKHLKRKQTLDLIAKRFYNLFGGSIEYRIEDMNIYDENGNFVAHPFEAPARFNKGVVEINLGYNDRKYTREEIEFYEEQDPFNVPWLTRETVAHEFMHPFVLALKTSNETLYNSLINELKETQKDIINHVNNLVAKGTYEEATKFDEALTLYLGKELTKAFRKNGTLDVEYVQSRPLLQRFIDWLNDIIDYIIGNTKPKTLEDFVRDASIDKASQKEYLNTLINTNEEVVDFLKKENGLIKKLRKLNKSKETVRQLYGSDIDGFDKLYEAISNYENNVNVGLSKFEFIIRPNDTHFVEFDETDPDNIKVYIDPKVSNENSLSSVVLISADRGISDNDVLEEFKTLVKNNATDFGSKEAGRKEITVAQLNPLMKLNDVTSYILYQLDDTTGNPMADKRMSIQFTPDEFSAIDSLVAYMNLDETEAKKFRKRITDKLPLLKDTADRRLNSDLLKQKYNIVNKLNLDYDDVNFALTYFQHANMSINLGWKQYMELKDDITGRIKRQDRIKELVAKPSLTNDEKSELSILRQVNDKAELTRLNKELGVIRQLMSFYDDFRKYTKYSDEFSSEDIIKFQKSIGFMDMLREDMQNTAINLAIEWFMPYAEKHNSYMMKEGYTDDKYMLTRQKFYDFFKYGTGQDTNYITFWLGSNVTSRDPINAVFANTLSDMLSNNNIDIYYKSLDLDIALKDFLKNKNINFINSEAQIKYYKDNYLRDAEVKMTETDPATGERKEVIVKKKALHQEYLFDKYELDLYEVRKKYSNPRNSEEDDLFKEKIEQWKKDNNYGKSEKYRNKEYNKVKNDPFFKAIEKAYNESNDRYDSRKLQFGVLPQKFDVGIVDKATRVIDAVRADKPAAEKIKEMAGNIQTKLAGIRKNTRQYNLDGSPYRDVSTDLINFKAEENISLNLPEIMVDFISESINHQSLRETQYQAETLSLLLEGNSKFGIEKRKFTKEDIGSKMFNMEQLKKARVEFEKLQQLKDDGEDYDKDLYDKLKEKLDKGLERRNVWDNLKRAFVPSETNYNNEMLLKQINDVYFGESQESVNVGNINLNKLAHYTSLYTSINNMAGNIVAGVSNVNIGNLQLFIEAHGGKYFNKKELAKATKDYITNIPTFISDLQNPIKSKDTQLSFLLDAVQGEIQDEFGTRVTGNIAKKLFRTNSLFLLTQLGEHQIQITGMKAMLLGRKIETKSGETISLYDAFVADENGRYGLRKDIKFTQEDLSKFIRDLHGVNRSLNGNYSDFNKTMLARKWYGTLLLKFRKYLYPSFRSRFASEHTDYERNTVEVGYFNYFFTKYIPEGAKALLAKLQGKEHDFNKLDPHQKYAVRKATFELGMYALLTAIGYGLFGGDGEDKKVLSDEEKFALLLLVRMRSDLGMYHVDLPSEFKRQIKSPTASLNTIVAVTDVLSQLTNPNEVYDKKYGNHEKGDSKLNAKMIKLLPVIRQLDMDLDGKLGYYNMINRNIEGVSPKSSMP